MLLIDKSGYEIISTVHDEVICEAPKEFGTYKELSSLLATQPKWADGLPLKAEGYEAQRYKK